MGPSSAALLLDEIAEAGLVPSGDFAHEVLGQLQVALRAGQSDMSEIRGQEWQLGVKVDILFTPQQKPKTRKGMAQVMEPNAAIRRPLDAGDFQRVMERVAERGDGIPTSAWAGEQRRVRDDRVRSALSQRRGTEQCAGPDPVRAAPLAIC